MSMAAAKPPPARISAPVRAPMSTTRRRSAPLRGVGSARAASRRLISTATVDEGTGRMAISVIWVCTDGSGSGGSWSASAAGRPASSGTSASRSVATWLADCGREAGCLPSSQEMRSHNESGTPAGRPGKRSAWLRRTVRVEPPAKGVTPQTSSYSMIPSAYRSVAGVGSLPSMSSGAMYWGVPTSMVLRPPVPSDWTYLAMPKSVSRGRPGLDAASTRTFSGLTSRWMTPAAWTAARPAAMPAPSSATRAGGSVRGPDNIARRSPPSTRSITMASVSPSTTRSRMLTTFGCVMLVRMERS